MQYNRSGASRLSFKRCKNHIKPTTPFVCGHMGKAGNTIKSSEKARTLLAESNAFGIWIWCILAVELAWGLRGLRVEPLRLDLSGQQIPKRLTRGAKSALGGTSMPRGSSIAGQWSVPTPGI
ncbi:hypothetical protein NA56DRAFT_705455 [Hyaloscypha hepaticicola]|uniref:Uncharacterized protein n=1 Tax=Hyaloscypha hepaticicola TaxID=2082293 RepID=A0A2J6Q0P6_9HELO|nr:hypothetical protein NA56DRAFT_705455 [Hyaloscypha hepaticicola]